VRSCTIDKPSYGTSCTHGGGDKIVYGIFRGKDFLGTLDGQRIGTPLWDIVIVPKALKKCFPKGFRMF